MVQIQLNMGILYSVNNRDLVLVIGASGFIGRHLTKLLLDRGFAVRVLSRRRYLDAGFSEIDERDWLTGDFCDPSVLQAACEGITAIFHLANIAHVKYCDHAELRRVNVSGARLVKDMATAAGVSYLIYFSSILADEPGHSHYACSKLGAENALINEEEEGSGGKLSVTILRPANVYGPGMKGNIATLIKRIKMGKVPPLPKLNNRLALISVSDLAIASLMTLNSSKANGKIYTLTDGQNYTPKRIEAAVYQAIGRKLPRWTTPTSIFYAASLGAQIANSLGIWKNDLGLRTYRNLVTDRPRSNKDIFDDLGFVPSQTLETGLPDILQAQESLDTH